jgi:hypothetical protein
MEKVKMKSVGRAKYIKHNPEREKAPTLKQMVAPVWWGGKFCATEHLKRRVLFPIHFLGMIGCGALGKSARPLPRKISQCSCAEIQLRIEQHRHKGTSRELASVLSENLDPSGRVRDAENDEAVLHTSSISPQIALLQ